MKISAFCVPKSIFANLDPRKKKDSSIGTL